MSKAMLFSYRERKSYVDPVSKVIWVASAIVVAFTVYSPWVQLLNLLYIVTVAVVLMRITLGELWTVSRYPLLIALSYFAVQLLLLPVPAGEQEILRYSFLVLSWKKIEYSEVISLRLFASVMASLTLAVTTHPRDLAASLTREFRINYAYTYLIFIGLRFLPLIEEELQNIKDAHLVRGIGGKKGIKGRLEEFQRYTIPLLATSIRRGRIMALSLDSKAFRAYPDRTSIVDVKWSLRGKVFSAACVLVAIAVIILTPYLDLALRRGL